MKSRLQIDLNSSKEIIIHAEHANTEDVRDKMVSMFLNEAAPSGFTLDGVAMIRRTCVDFSEGSPSIEHFEIVPIHPLEIEKYIPIFLKIVENFKSGCAGNLPKANFS